MNYLLDTNAVINYLHCNGNFSMINESDELFISFITFIELSVGYKDHEEESLTQLFLETVYQKFIDESIICKTIEVRKRFSFKLPDSIIVATALTNDFSLITSDRRIVTNSSELNLQTIDPMY